MINEQNKLGEIGRRGVLPEYLKERAENGERKGGDKECVRA